MQKGWCVMATILRIYSNGTFERVLAGIELVNNHQCAYHTKPCAELEYIFSDTNKRTFALSRWCEQTVKENRYFSTRKNQDIKYYCDCVKTYSHIYVLSLEDNKWYVGITSRPTIRMQEHADGVGAKWTAKYSVIHADVQSFPKPLPECKALCEENKKVKEICELYGAENVRGGDWNG
ncbi:MAG: hypothetical protein ACRDFB_04920 [Rhabdochlamydiaceae bacterium]